MKKYTTLISTEELAGQLNDPECAIFDCRFLLNAPDQEEQNYQEAHIPGAVYAHLDRNLSSPVVSGVTGRHPWLSTEQAAGYFSRIGIGPGIQVVAYDGAGGALAAVRLWWMLRWMGHEAAAVLDGGWQKWVSEKREVQAGVESRSPQPFIPSLRPELLVSIEDVDQRRLNPAYRIFDARASERYHGRNETIDPIAGHIPGAFSAPYTDNLSPEGTFKGKEELRFHYQDLLEKIPPENAIFYCGSGVTSIHNILAIMVADLGEAKLYPGSWSEWIADSKRPVVT